MFSINNTVITILNYPISLVELIGTVTGLISVILAGRNKISNYPIGIINIIFFFILFYQVQLYSDMFEQVYYFVVSIIGWYLWVNPKESNKNKKDELRISNNSLKETMIYAIITLVGSIILGLFMANIHTLLPQFFAEPASYPYLDAFTTIMSLLAMYMLAKRKIDNWYLWILVDIIAVVLYFVKDVKLLSIEYFIFLVNAIVSFKYWKKTMKKEEMEHNE
jgi:nicotinamide mononucleotide transporter